MSDSCNSCGCQSCNCPFKLQLIIKPEDGCYYLQGECNGCESEVKMPFSPTAESIKASIQACLAELGVTPDTFGILVPVNDTEGNLLGFNWTEAGGDLPVEYLFPVVPKVPTLSTIVDDGSEIAPALNPSGDIKIIGCPVNEAGVVYPVDAQGRPIIPVVESCPCPVFEDPDNPGEYLPLPTDPDGAPIVPQAGPDPYSIVEDGDETTITHTDNQGNVVTHCVKNCVDPVGGPQGQTYEWDNGQQCIIRELASNDVPFDVGSTTWKVDNTTVSVPGVSVITDPSGTAAEICFDPNVFDASVAQVITFDHAICHPDGTALTATNTINFTPPPIGTVRLDKTFAPENANVGDVVNMTVSVCNEPSATGPITDITFTDAMPADLSYVGNTAPTAGSFTGAGQNLSWAIPGPIAPGDCEDVVVQVEVLSINASGAIHNIASVTGDNGTGPGTTSDSAIDNLAGLSHFYLDADPLTDDQPQVNNFADVLNEFAGGGLVHKTDDAQNVTQTFTNVADLQACIVASGWTPVLDGGGNWTGQWTGGPNQPLKFGTTIEFTNSLTTPEGIVTALSIGPALGPNNDLSQVGATTMEFSINGTPDGICLTVDDANGNTETLDWGSFSDFAAGINPDNYASLGAFGTAFVDNSIFDGGSISTRRALVTEQYDETCRFEVGYYNNWTVTIELKENFCGGDTVYQICPVRGWDLVRPSSQMISNDSTQDTLQTTLKPRYGIASSCKSIVYNNNVMPNSAANQQWVFWQSDTADIVLNAGAYNTAGPFAGLVSNGGIAYSGVNSFPNWTTSSGVNYVGGLGMIADANGNALDVPLWAGSTGLIDLPYSDNLSQSGGRFYLDNRGGNPVPISGPVASCDCWVLRSQWRIIASGTLAGIYQSARFRVLKDATIGTIDDYVPADATAPPESVVSGGTELTPWTNANLTPQAIVNLASDPICMSDCEHDVITFEVEVTTNTGEIIRAFKQYRMYQLA